MKSHLNSLKLFWTVSASVLFCTFSFGQAEMLKPLKTNTQLKTIGAKALGISSTIDTLCIPFFEDFSSTNAMLDSLGIACQDTVFRSNKNPYIPNPNLWLDDFVFVNNEYPIKPPSIGVATFDGLNANGSPYSGGSGVSGNADYLTSKPFFLGSFSAGDSLYLSFYFQAQGYGNLPETNDSLVVEFKNALGVWKKVWGTPGIALDSFQQVLVPVLELQHLIDGFQFRFRNRSTLTGNFDHWHLDYIRLESGRSKTDTILVDVAAYQAASNYLMNYVQMPWNQFKDYQSSEVNPGVESYLRNNGNIVINTDHSLSVSERSSGSSIYSVPTASFNFFPNKSKTLSYPGFTIPSTTPNYGNDSFLMDLEFLSDPQGTEFTEINDTLRVEQAFYNFFAYDDGSAEAAYALSGSGSQFALKFELNEADSLRGLYVHFPYIDEDLSDQLFSIKVWTDIDTSAGNTGGETVEYIELFQTPHHADGVNGFTFYRLFDPVFLNAGTFYIGFLQDDPDFLNVGFDFNNPQFGKNLWYNIGGKWEKSAFDGGLMLRPFIGADYQGIIAAEENLADLNASLEIFPNPSSGTFMVKWMDLPRFSYEVFSLQGALMQSGMLERDQNLVLPESLPQGNYLLRLRHKAISESRIFGIH